jgi:phosphoenolpyruvate-protein kinase (PTS system EI component)
LVTLAYPFFCLGPRVPFLPWFYLFLFTICYTNSTLTPIIKIATERGRRTRQNLKLGICGEHGGDPASVRFCQEVGLDYVSCSPYRVPIARLAAAQAALAKDPDSTTA